MNTPILDVLRGPFDKVTQQGERCVRDGDDSFCNYRNGKGQRCIFGHALPVDADESWDTIFGFLGSAGDLRRTYPDLVNPYYYVEGLTRQESAALWAVAQNLHDDEQRWCGDLQFTWGGSFDAFLDTLVSILDDDHLCDEMTDIDTTSDDDGRLSLIEKINAERNSLRFDVV